MAAFVSPSLAHCASPENWNAWSPTNSSMPWSSRLRRAEYRRGSTKDSRRTLEPTDHTWMLQRLRSAPALIPLSRLEAGFAQLDGVDPILAYAESVVAARVLVERLGANFPVFLQYVGNGTSVEQALLLFNISAADIERGWSRRTRAAR